LEKIRFLTFYNHILLQGEPIKHKHRNQLREQPIDANSAKCGNQGKPHTSSTHYEMPEKYCPHAEKSVHLLHCFTSAFGGIRMFHIPSMKEDPVKRYLEVQGLAHSDFSETPAKKLSASDISEMLGFCLAHHCAQLRKKHDDESPIVLERAKLALVMALAYNLMKIANDYGQEKALSYFQTTLRLREPILRVGKCELVPFDLRSLASLAAGHKMPFHAASLTEESVYQDLRPLYEKFNPRSLNGQQYEKRDASAPEEFILEADNLRIELMFQFKRN